MILQSCSDSESKNLSSGEKKNWCKYLVYGQYEYRTRDKNVNIILRFYQENGVDRFTVCYEIGEEDYYDGYRIIKGIQLSPIDRFEDDNYSEKEFFVLNSKDVKYNSAIEFIVKERDGLDSGQDIYSPEIAKEKLKIKFLDDGAIELVYKNVTDLLINHFSASKEENIDKVILKKTQGVNDCWDYNPNVSFEKFTVQEKAFIEHDLVLGEQLEVADKDLMLDYMFRDGWNKVLEDFGSVYKVDLNSDGEQDICGYFTHEYEKEKSLTFKIFLFNGYTYDEAYSEDISDYFGGGGIFYPCENAVCIDIPDEGGGTLYYNKLRDEFETHWND